MVAVLVAVMSRVIILSGTFFHGANMGVIMLSDTFCHGANEGYNFF